MNEFHSDLQELSCCFTYSAVTQFLLQPGIGMTTDMIINTPINCVFISIYILIIKQYKSMNNIISQTPTNSKSIEEILMIIKNIIEFIHVLIIHYIKVTTNKLIEIARQIRNNSNSNNISMFGEDSMLDSESSLMLFEESESSFELQGIFL